MERLRLAVGGVLLDLDGADGSVPREACGHLRLDERLGVGILRQAVDLLCAAAWRIPARDHESHCRADDANERKAKHGHGGNAVRVQATGGDQSGFIIASSDSAKAFPMSANVFAHPR